MIAWGQRPRERDKFINQALKGRNIYLALSGLAMKIVDS
jgi:hypothetical protein